MEYKHSSAFSKTGLGLNGLRHNLRLASLLESRLSNPFSHRMRWSSSTPPTVTAITRAVPKFTPTTTLAQVKATGAPSLTVGNQTLYIGTWQKDALNQNPIVASFNPSTGARNWVRTNYETTGADGRGYGLFSNGTSLYGLFTLDGTQGLPEQDFRRSSSTATPSWMRSYGKGGGAKVTVLSQLDPTTGALKRSVYLSSVLSNGNSNSLTVDGATIDLAGNVQLRAVSYFAPRAVSGAAMQRVDTTLTSPFRQVLKFASDLKLLSSTAIGWN